MRIAKRLTTVALAGMMAFTLAAPVMAADYNITITDSKTGNVKTSEHTMDAYQLFKGKLATVNDKKVLSDITWGNGFDPAALITALKADATLGTIEAITNLSYNTAAPAASAQALAEAIAEFNTAQVTALNTVLAAQATTVYATNNGTNSITIKEEDAGYYFIKDDTNPLPDKNDAYSDYILQVLGDVEIQIKTDAPSISKKIRDGQDLVDTSSTSIGEKVNYHLSSVIPDTSKYDTAYYYYMTDTFSKGLTFNNDVTAYIDVNDNDAYDQGTDVLLTKGDSSATAAADDYYVYTSKDATTAETTVQIAFTKVLTYGQTEAYVGKDICVDYSGTINSSAVIGKEGNPNDVDLSYSNKPSYDYAFDTSKPGLPDSETVKKNVIGTTPKDKVKSYVTEIDLTKYADKVDENYELEGAEFTLTGTATRSVVKSEEVFTEDLNGTWYLLKDGTYTETAPTTTDMTTMRALTADEKKTATKGYVIRTDEQTADTDVTIDGVTYRVVNNGETPEYILRTATSTNSLYASTTTYSKKTVTTTTNETYTVKKVFVTGADGVISFTGLDAGTYTLKETVTPPGYNTCDDINFTIECGLPTEISTGNETCTWTIKDVTGATVDDFKDANQLGKYAINIIDKSGSVLPSTGGMGTTLFYVFGIIMVAGAGVVLITRRRLAK